jgi:hypothetical protein
MSADVEYKTSMFVHCDEQDLILFNDLTNRAFFGDEEDIALLARLADSPATLQDMVSFPGIDELDERVQFFLSERMLVPVSTDETFSFIPHHVDIETCRQCNARCKFCPQSIAPKSRGVMSLDLFSLVLSRLDGTTPEWITLNHYGEPLVDPFFRQRVGLLRERNFPLALFTNGILLKDPIIDFLAPGGVFKIVINFPSLEPSEWCELMQMPEQSYWKARRAIEYSLQIISNMPQGVQISVNGVTDTQATRVQQIKDHFSTFGRVKVRMEFSNSRAGAVQNELVQITPHSVGRRYGGCDQIANNLHVSSEGKVFLCCQDYDQNVVLGDLTQDSYSTIMSGPLARQLRAEMFGIVPMPKGRLCLNCHALRQSRFPKIPGRAALYLFRWQNNG